MTGMTVQAIKIADISPNRFQPRKRFGEAELAELAASIKDKGLLQPVTIRPVTDGSTPYELVMGERRLRATSRNGDETINCIVREMSDEDSREIAIIENLQRADLAPIEEAQSVRDLVDAYGGNKDIAAEKLKKSTDWVKERLTWLTLPPEVQTMIDEKKLNGEQTKFLLKMVEKSATAERLIEVAKTMHRLQLSANSARGMFQQDVDKPKGQRMSSGEAKPVNHAKLVTLFVSMHDGMEMFDFETLGEGEKRTKKLETLKTQAALVRERVTKFEEELRQLPAFIPSAPKSKDPSKRPVLTIKKSA